MTDHSEQKQSERAQSLSQQGHVSVHNAAMLENQMQISNWLDVAVVLQVREAKVIPFRNPDTCKVLSPKASQRSMCTSVVYP